jgi:hypothetical protein
MSIPTYVEGYPPDGSSLGSTKAQIRANLDGTFETLGVDHINNNGQPGTGTPGYHNVIHFQDQGAMYTTPPTVSGVTQMYTNTDTNSVQQLFLESTGGNPYQQTMMLDAQFATLGTNPGWTYLPGGLVIQYGGASVSTGAHTTTITTPFAFNHTIFKVFVTATYTGTAPTASELFVAVNIVDSQHFKVFTNTPSSQFNGFYWVALGTMI